jgi:hypothetical protein
LKITARRDLRTGATTRGLGTSADHRERDGSSHIIRTGVMARPRKAALRIHRPDDPGDVRLFTLDVSLIDGPVHESFVERNPVVSRVIQIRGDQTLADLHEAIYDAFGRWDEHLYEFQFGKKMMDPKARRYVVPMEYEMDMDLVEDGSIAGLVDQTRIDSLGLKVRQSFYYWFDFGDDWWHKIKVKAIVATVPEGEFPKVVGTIGENPPQYLWDDDEDDDGDIDEDVD